MVDFDDFDIGPQSDEALDAMWDRDFDDEPFDRDMRDDEAAFESVYGPEDDGYSDFGGFEFPEFDE